MRDTLVIILFYCDNVATINIANNPIQFDWTKYVEIDRFFIKEKMDSGALKLEYVKSHDQLVDYLQNLDHKDNELACNKMDTLNIFSPSWGGELLVYCCNQ